MGLFDGVKSLTVNEGINRARTQKDAVLLDIRTKEAFKQGHIAGSVHVPLDRIEQVQNRIRSADTTIYVVGDYHHNPKKAVHQLKKMGYKNAVASGNMEEHHGIMKK